MNPSSCPPEPAETHSFIARVRAALPQLPPSERRLAEFLLDFPGNLSSYAAAEMAKLTGVSNATVTRFIQRLGYEGYEDARRHARAQGDNGSPLFLAAASAQGRPTADVIATHLRQASENLAVTIGQISADQLDAIAMALIGARQLFFVGYRQNRNFAAYLRWQLMQALEMPSQVIPGAGETLGEYAAQIGENDVVVIFALRRSVRVVSEFARQARLLGARLICITDHASPAPEADWLLRVQTSAPGPLDNHTALFMLCHLIATATLQQSGQPGRRHMAAIETSHDALDEML
ncbi:MULTISPECIES: MurR/RpiR family transcriptional regulator [Comamonas]|uniref:MurR/RpiR family transcriptional regulator n=1 Tax=Comamonas TaxID=283 RepID=UPI000E0B462D|nr:MULTISPECIES: MurR/RpiR family transcriptional regulator [Comamonas]RDI14139.1 RpiR family transcriptional regulator [Comamonas sp. AG1104]